MYFDRREHKLHTMIRNKMSAVRWKWIVSTALCLLVAFYGRHLILKEYSKQVSKEQVLL